MSIERLFEDFSRCADASTSRLQEMLATISLGQVPQRERVTELDESIEDLRQKYTSVYQAAREQLTEDEMPEEGAPVLALVDAVQNSQKLRIEKQLKEAEECLKRFLSIHSFVQAYANALMPYQDQARSLLDSIRARDGSAIETLEKDTKGPRALLTAIAYEDKDSDEGIALCDQVDKYFHKLVGKGVVAGKYHIAQDDTDVRQKTEEDTVVASFDNCGTLSENTVEGASVRATLEDEHVADPVTDAVTEASEATLQEVDGSDVVSTEEQEVLTESSSFVRALKEVAYFVEDEQSWGEMTAEEPKSISKKVSSSIFTNEIKTGYSNAKKEIVRTIEGSGSVTVRYMSELRGIPENIALESLEDLLKKGYLRKYSLQGAEELYCVSERLLKALSFAEACKLVGIKKKSCQQWGKDVSGKVSNAVTRLAMLDMIMCMIKRFARSGYITCSSTNIQMDSFVCKAWSKSDPLDVEIAIGAFWTNDLECDIFLQALREQLKGVESVSAIFIAAFDKDRARSLAEIVSSELGSSFEYRTAYLHSYSDKAYCTYPELEPVEDVTADLQAKKVDEDTSEADENTKEEAPVASEADEDTKEEAPVASVADEDTKEEAPVASEADEDTKEEAPVDSAADEDTKEEAPVASEADEDTKEEAPVASEADENTKEEDTSTTGQDTEPVSDEMSRLDSKSIAVAATPVVQRNIVKKKTAILPLDKIREHTYEMLCDRRFYAALAYQWAWSKDVPEVELLYRQLAYALNDPMAHCFYSTENAFDLIAVQDRFENYLVISLALRLLFSNQVRFDYALKSFYDSIKDYTLLEEHPNLRSVLYTLVEFKDKQKAGVEFFASYQAKSHDELERELQALNREATSFYESFIVGRKKEKCSQPRFVKTKELMFSVNSDMGQYLKAIIDQDFEMVSLVELFLYENFYSADALLEVDSYDDDKVWDYILRFWNEAGANTPLKRRETPYSRLKSNITNETVKVIQFLVKWCKLVKRLNDQADDEATIEYRRIKNGLFDHLSCVLHDMQARLDRGVGDLKERAGSFVLAYTIEELCQCLKGLNQGNRRTYFYVPFLLTGDVTLRDDLFPEPDVHFSSLESLQFHARVLEHFETVRVSEKTYMERLDDILKGLDDDYGSARQIMDYLDAVDARIDLPDLGRLIEESCPYAKQNADINKADFVGNLELAQSYGQIDNSEEDKKEMILQIVGEWYAWAEETSNYGFFSRVTEEYLRAIKDMAEKRGEDLRAQLDELRSETIPGLSLEKKGQRIARIESMIKDQNYTVAEDLLSRLSSSESDGESLISEDLFKLFMDNYEDYYTPVARGDVNLASIVNSRGYNKEDRAAKRLADNWSSGGRHLGENKLQVLLTELGYQIEQIEKQEEIVSGIVRLEHYVVKMSPPRLGDKLHSSHPIAALGSATVKEGLRIVCVNGRYDADGLINIMKSIGNTLHTLILLDHALDKPQRKILARLTKKKLGDKFFGVLDRTVMLFLIRNYDVTNVNSMMAALICPFGYYQPYVWESVNTMPPEIFMGRKRELESIMSPTGVNIVYGGRQLGKSALLKKAREVVDHNDSQHRAIYVDIKDKKYEDAARKVSDVLCACRILDEGFTTTDWDELTNAIKRRLFSETAPKIPFLLLLLDEADDFINSSGEVGYHPFDALVELQSEANGQFKFVIAGLRDVIRFKRSDALRDNRILIKVPTMTVKPFAPAEARELLEIPLHYLGLRFPKEKESLITLILATTNYFPGSIQFYCAKLIEAMRRSDYAGYTEQSSPPYEVSEDHIKKVLADPDFTKMIYNMLEITLGLGEEEYYIIIALLLAYLYHNNGYRVGYKAEEIKCLSEQLQIGRIASMKLESISALMEELCELNVLRKTDETGYLFSRFAFFQMMGTISDVEDKLMKYMEG